MTFKGLSIKQMTQYNNHLYLFSDKKLKVEKYENNMKNKTVSGLKGSNPRSC